MIKSAVKLLLFFCAFGVIPFGRAANPPRIVFMIGEEAYHTGETLPDFAGKELKALGYQSLFVFSDAADKNNFPGLIEALRDADLLFISVRRRTPHKDQLDAVRAHVAAGKPLMGIRTASHAFALTPKDTLTDPAKLAIWPDFDLAVLGAHFSGHQGKDNVTISLAPGANAHPVLHGVNISLLTGHGGLYQYTPLDKDATALLLGTVSGQPAQPVAWTHVYGPKKARVFYTSLGHADDFNDAEFRRFLGNGVTWALGK